MVEKIGESTPGISEAFTARKEGGKFFLYDASRGTDRHEIFFDDNVHFDDLKIIRPFNRPECFSGLFGRGSVGFVLCSAICAFVGFGVGFDSDVRVD